jgi:hypothetical protein
MCTQQIFKTYLGVIFNPQIKKDQLRKDLCQLLGLGYTSPYISSICCALSILGGLPCCGAVVDLLDPCAAVPLLCFLAAAEEEEEEATATNEEEEELPPPASSPPPYPVRSVSEEDATYGIDLRIPVAPSPLPLPVRAAANPELPLCCCCCCCC